MQLKKIFIILLITALTSQVYAGSSGIIGDDDKPSKLIFNVGMTNAKFDLDNFNFKTDLMLGIQRDVKIFPSIRFNAAIFFNQIGSQIPDEPAFNLDYLQIPIGLKVKIGPVYALGGLSGAYRLSAKQSDIDISDEIKSIDFAVHAGVGFKFLIFSLEGRYNWGLTDIYQGRDPEKYNINNRYFQLMLGVHLP